MLELNENQIAIIPPEIGSLKALIDIDLSYNQIMVIAPELGSLTALVILSLNNNQLTTLPPEIGSLTALRHLSLEHNQLTSLPPELGNLTGLYSIDLRFNELTSLPPKFGNLTALIWLYLENNELTTLPSEIINFELDSLDLNNNQLCNLSTPIIDWIDEYSTSELPWEESQKSDDTHYCDGTKNKLPTANPKLDFTIHHTVFNDQVTFTFNNLSTANEVRLAIYNTGGKQVKRFENVSGLVIWNTAGQDKGVYYLKAMIGSKDLTRKFVLK